MEVDESQLQKRKQYTRIETERDFEKRPHMQPSTEIKMQQSSKKIDR